MKMGPFVVVSGEGYWVGVGGRNKRVVIERCALEFPICEPSPGADSWSVVRGAIESDTARLSGGIQGPRATMCFQVHSQLQRGSSRSQDLAPWKDHTDLAMQAMGSAG